MEKEVVKTGDGEEKKQNQVSSLYRLRKKQNTLAKLHEEDDDEDDDDKMKLNAIAMGLNIRLRSANMPSSMQEHALCFTNSILHRHNTSTCSPSPSLLARSLKKEFDSLYGQVWHCIVGKSFGSFVTHSPGGFIYFSVDSHNLSFLLFKTEVQLIPA